MVIELIGGPLDGARLYVNDLPADHLYVLPTVTGDGMLVAMAVLPFLESTHHDVWLAYARCPDGVWRFVGYDLPAKARK